MTFSQIGELTGVSRQMIARLYRQTESSDEVDGVIRSKRQRVAHHDRDLGASS
jgi:hypothetical protein